MMIEVSGSVQAIITTAALEQIFGETLDDNLFAPQLADEKKLAVALSGGADSIVLTYLLHRWCKVVGKELLAIHVNHGLRPGADDEADILKNEMAAWGVPLLVQRLPPFGHGGNLHHRARQARYVAIATMAAAAGVRRVFFAHQQNDSAENFFIRLQRAAGLSGLAAMKSVAEYRTDGDVTFTIMRPLLAVPRAVLRSYAIEKKLFFIDDASNDDERFLRARVRHWLGISEQQQLLSVRQVAASANHLRAAADFLADIIDQEKKRLVVNMGNVVVIKKILPTNGDDGTATNMGKGLVHPFLLRQLLLSVWQEFRGHNFPPAAEQIDTMLNNIESLHGEKIFSYRDAWVVNRPTEILLFKKAPTKTCAVPAHTQRDWGRLYRIINNSDRLLQVAPFGRGKKFLQKTFGRDFIPPPVDDFLSATTCRYFYQQQPMLSFDGDDNYLLPTLGLGLRGNRAGRWVDNNISLSPLAI